MAARRLLVLPLVLVASHARAQPAHPSHEPQIDGRAFPDKVIALTWDDGPDAQTLKLAEYLSREKVPATFFVVNEWVRDQSSDPGAGDHVFETGYAHLPVLGDLVRLGHRVANHTMHHVLLDACDAPAVARELRSNHDAIAPFITNELFLFRAPGGAWSAGAAAAVDADPVLARLVGPIRWDVDAKDWECSVECKSARPAIECEPAGPGGAMRVKPAVTAQRYVGSIDAVGRGIVLLHDRVGHVGSSYAIDLAHALVPALKARGYVFAPPVLAFSSLAPRPPARADLGDEPLALPPGYGSAIRVGDVNGDGLADWCARTDDGIACARGAFGAFEAVEPWSFPSDFRDRECSSMRDIRLGDLNGDGRADVCGLTCEGVVCALSTGRSFARASVWLPIAHAPELRTSSFELADRNGDGRADLCIETEDPDEASRCAFAP